MLFPFYNSSFLSICSTNQRRRALVPHRTGEKARMLPVRSKRRLLLAARTRTASASNPWSSTWQRSTSWRANNLLFFLVSLLAIPIGAPHTQPYLWNKGLQLWGEEDAGICFQHLGEELQDKKKKSTEAPVLLSSTGWRQSANTTRL